MQKQQLEITPNTFVKRSRSLYFAILASMVFIPLFFYSNLENKEFKIDFKNNLFLSSIAIAVLVIFASNFIFKILKEKIEQKMDLKLKIAKLQTANLVRYMILEAPVFLVVFSFSPDKSFFIIPLLIFLSLLIIMPNKEKLEDDLNLTSQQKIQFSKGDEIIK